MAALPTILACMTGSDDFSHLAEAHALGDDPIPGAVVAVSNGHPVELVWRNELGGLTFGFDDHFIKWNPLRTDRWADLAIASLSLDWNFGEGHQDELFAVYGIEPDIERIRYYRALWDLES